MNDIRSSLAIAFVPFRSSCACQPRRHNIVLFGLCDSRLLLSVEFVVSFILHSILHCIVSGTRSFRFGVCSYFSEKKHAVLFGALAFHLVNRAYTAQSNKQSSVGRCFASSLGKIAARVNNPFFLPLECVMW